MRLLRPQRQLRSAHCYPTHAVSRLGTVSPRRHPEEGRAPADDRLRGGFPGRLRALRSRTALPVATSAGHVGGDMGSVSWARCVTAGGAREAGGIAGVPDYQAWLLATWPASTTSSPRMNGDAIGRRRWTTRGCSATSCQWKTKRIRRAARLIHPTCRRSNCLATGHLSPPPPATCFPASTLPGPSNSTYLPSAGYSISRPGSYEWQT